MQYKVGKIVHGMVHNFTEVHTTNLVNLAAGPMHLTAHQTSGKSPCRVNALSSEHGQCSYSPYYYSLYKATIT